LIFAGAVAVLFLIIGGFRYVVSAGNPDQVEGAKKTILYAILGLIVIFVAYVLVTLLQGWLGVTNGFSLNS
jgi:NADH:ubiquinone oxidoreductase subunit 6 (subunit J)